MLFCARDPKHIKTTCVLLMFVPGQSTKFVMRAQRIPPPQVPAPPPAPAPPASIQAKYRSPGGCYQMIVPRIYLYIYIYIFIHIYLHIYIYRLTGTYAWFLEKYAWLLENINGFWKNKHDILKNKHGFWEIIHTINAHYHY